ncbi:hypothetical protein A2223_04145 [Candidatus Falkowbacteria bacterium RIFOXYA2_FULL_35_8]|uniref:Uncharacterized protein n=1 Tax=Candidatus Falkowbacteria bacterium RIFOXYC2_FULL_36_12 TaxID=1798002 RepID=A0A1F5SZR8_9BACT|nr:MAG: hypothetical protein A2300_02830 [Candidatus Falkowbacteria bacterium RIFOXYB2_FULL_35_7]OGF31721.1 MAG: hypothetical protein A2478_04520 [Candidatus Falkowbacteria bacterium RIFOXYC2_FULL_36_12]OGF33649.1 MAG: hypothetical protein A2223_04145 [Candidatus Falkowbacteria bacterium RIFOXYA2_FULL_35_8]
MLQIPIVLLTVVGLWLLYFLVYLPNTPDSTLRLVYVGLLVVSATFGGFMAIRARFMGKK